MDESPPGYGANAQTGNLHRSRNIGDWSLISLPSTASSASSPSSIPSPPKGHLPSTSVYASANSKSKSPSPNPCYYNHFFEARLLVRTLTMLLCRIKILGLMIQKAPMQSTQSVHRFACPSHLEPRIPPHMPSILPGNLRSGSRHIIQYTVPDPVTVRDETHKHLIESISSLS